MLIRRLAIGGGGLALLLAGAAVARATDDHAATPGEFSVMHISDIHVEPHLARSGRAGPVRGAETIKWIVAQAALPQEIPPFNLTAPPPAFTFATGDLTEYGVIDGTWDLFEAAFRELPCPLYVVPGNHDNTWGALYAVMRQRHQGENYSFDHAGCHFIGLSSASPQEPVPSIDAKTRAWLKDDLSRTPAATPIFIALHHPLHSSEFANPTEYDTLIDLLRDHNVVMLLYGHGHGVEYRDFGGIAGVMGGSTFGKTAGYGLLSVQPGKVRYAYRYEQGGPAATDQQTAGPAWQKVYEGPLPTAAPPRLFQIARPAPDAALNAGQLIAQLTVLGDGTLPAGTRATFRIDGQELATVTGAAVLEPVPLAANELTAGAHLLSVTVQLADQRSDLRTRSFLVARPDTELVWRKQLPAAIKAQPLVIGDTLVIAGNDGRVTALDKRTGTEQWSFTTGGEILGRPAWSGAAIVFGSGDGQVYAVSDAGKLQWKFEAGAPVYGWPLIAGGSVYIGDNGGRLHALDVSDGTRRWTFERADFTIESQPAVWGDLIVCGAWDGYLYALNGADGKLRWKAYGPAASEKKSRYYAPADCGPVVINETLFVCDRGYELGTFSATGEMKAKWANKASGIAAGADGETLYARTNDDRVLKLNARGEPVWEAKVPAGRFPIAPTVHDDRVYVCSNRGLLSVLDAQTGKPVWNYQATPGLFVMAPVTVDAGDAAGPVCYVAGMDGSLTAVRARPTAGSARGPG
ncbi:MAG: PQQ-binding-like beta-propeller repeat protein [Phycisphaerae bacterium]|nr:PQQ-binding-like beta-propeller repeat protein [Phycisphaerae bacterium]